MAALVQTYAQENTTSPIMLQTRPPSSTGRMSSGQYGTPPSQAPRAVYSGNAALTGYRGGSMPMQQYAFRSTAGLNQVIQPQHLVDPISQHGRFANPQLVNTMPALNLPQIATPHDLAMLQARQTMTLSRPHTSHLTVEESNRAAHERHKWGNAQPSPHSRSHSANIPSSSAINLPNTAQFYGIPNNSRSSLRNRPPSFYATGASVSMDDMHLSQQPVQDVRGMRRRSMVGQNMAGSLRLPDLDQLNHGTLGNNFNSPSTVPMPATHSRNGSSDSVTSSRSNRSRQSSVNRTMPAAINSSGSVNNEGTSSLKQDSAKSVTVPPRGSSSDAAKRSTTPSPLSKPVNIPSSSTTQGPAGGNLDTPAAKHLAAINEKGKNKGKSKTSRLRRAFSFGSAAEFKKATIPEESVTDKSIANDDDGLDPEQARIAQAQEAAGIGSGIYGSRFFGSTDNLSISSTASSASVMIRKMGRGMKRSSRSFAGLFRPKSSMAQPTSEPVVPETSEATVTMVNVEAEAQRVNVSAEPQASDGFPHLERNSLDAAQVPEMKTVVTERTGSAGTDSSSVRKSIVGGDSERAEVLAAVRKGILKRSGSASPSIRPIDMDLPSVPAITDSPYSSAPSTPNDEAQGHRRTGSVTLGSEDYFMTALRLRQDSKSAPNTPQGTVKRNATFSPRIIFHDTWPPQEYDRRGDVATCNRLTPLLAQQIKEELNSFKMEMEVHENSKIYTHFF